jgi:hypothetical protein
MNDSMRFLLAGLILFGSATVTLLISLALIEQGLSLIQIGEEQPEYYEYISIRDYSNCTKENDELCKLRGSCVHYYRQCQIDACGSEGIGW